MDQQPRITLQFIQYIFPTEQHILSRGTMNLRSIKHLGRIQVGPLDRQRRRGPSPCQLHRLLDFQISRHLFEHQNRLFKFDLRQVGTGFQQMQYDVQSPHLKIGRQLRHVGVARNHMQPPKPGRIRMRFVTRVDDRALDHRIEVQQTFKKVRALRDLIFRWSGLIFRPDFSRPGKDRPGDEKRRQCTRNPIEWDGP